MNQHPAWALLARYRAVWQAAWQARHQLAGPARLADEQAFLPAALSLQETPPHPAPRRAALSICALFVAALTWSILGELDVVAVAQGRVIVGDRSKLIQPLEAAVVRAIHVQDGDTVQAGQLLVELDPTAALADSGRLTEERRAAHSEAWRTQALLAALEAEATTVAEAARAQPGDTEPAFEGWRPQDQEAAYQQFKAEWREHRARLARQSAETARRRAELATAREVLAKLRATLPLARQRERDVQGLSAQGFMSGHASQDRTRERVELERDQATAQARIAEAQAGLEESKRTQAALTAETRRTWQDRAAQARLKVAALAQEDTKASQRSSQTRLTAPVAGTVQQLAIHTPGGVVTPAQALMVIVPGGGTDGGVVAEVSFENKDIGFVRAGQHAEVKFETFNFTRYGTVPGTVQWVSADAVVQPGGGAAEATKPTNASVQAIFPARLVLSQAELAVEGKRVRLGPGLNLTAEVRVGKRKVIDYLLSPATQSLNESMREQ